MSAFDPKRTFSGLSIGTKKLLKNPVFRLQSHLFLGEDTHALASLFSEAGRASPNRSVLDITVLRRAADLRENANALAP